MQFLGKLFNIIGIKVLMLALLFGLPGFSVYGMEGEEIGLRGIIDQLGQGLTGEASESWREAGEAAINSIEGQLGNSLGELDVSVADAYKSDLKGLQKGLLEGKITPSEVPGKMQEIFAQDRVQMINNLKNALSKEGVNIGPMQESILSKIPELSDELKNISVQAEGNLLPFGNKAAVQVDPEELRLITSITKTKLTVAEAELSLREEGLIESTDEELEKARAKVKNLEKEYNQLNNQYTQSLKNEELVAEGDLNSSRANLSKAVSKGDSTQIETQEVKIAEAQEKVKNQEGKEKTAAKQSRRDDYKEKEADYAAKKDEVKRVKQKIKDLNKDINTLQDQLSQYSKDSDEYKNLEAQRVEKETDLKTTEDNLKKAEGARDDAKKAYETAWTKYYTEGKWLSSAGKWKFYEGYLKPGLMGFGSSFLSSIVFMFPGWAMQAWQTYNQNQTMLDNLEADQKFGGISMHILDGLIDHNNPANSHFIYVGNDAPGGVVTDSQKPYANYYVSINEQTGAIAEAPVFSGNCTMMLHLNSGLVFSGDGEPVNTKVPTLELLGNKVSDEFKKEDSPFSAITLQEVLNDAAGKTNPLSGNTTTWWFGEESSGFPGEPTVGEIMRSGNDQKIPKILQRLVQTLQSGGYFGKMQVQGITAFGQEQLDYLTKSLINNPDTGGSDFKLLPLTKVPDVYDYPIAQGTYIYQTQDTPFAQTMLQQIKADDPTEQVQHNSIYDYVVFVNDPNNPIPVPLYIPSIKDGSAPTWDINPNAQYMISLVEPTISLVDSEGKVTPLLTMYDLKGTMYVGKFDETNTVIDAVKKMKNGSAWLEQIDLVKEYFAFRSKNGPFNYGNYVLTIDPNLSIKNIPIYQIKGSLEDGGDDYVVSLLDTAQGISSLMLPRRKYMEDQSGVQQFVSLVTSRVYTIAESTTDANSMIIVPDTLEIPYWIVTTNGVQSLSITPQSWSPAGKAPLYTLFVDEAFNPTELPAGVNSLPTGAQWAINNIEVNDPQSTTPKSITIAQLFETYGGDAAIAQLKSGITNSYNSWKIYNNNTYPADVDRQMGPFTWIEGLESVQFMATSATDIKNNIFVYKSAEYPEEYLVMSMSKAGIKGTPFFDQANPQPYAVSLTTGNVYDRNKKGIKVATLGLAQLLQASGIPQTVSIYTDIKNSQANALAQMRQNLYGPATQFGAYQLYVRASDYMNNQFIYADATGLGDPLNPGAITENNSVVNKITDYFVCMERVPQKDGQGNVIVKDGQIQYVPGQYTFGTELGADTYAVVSLVTGAAFARSGYFANYKDFNISAQDPVSFAQIILKSFIPQPIDGTLYARIQTLTNQEYQKYLKELKEIKKDQEAEQALQQDLSQNILLNLAQSSYIPDNPNEAPRYLVQYSKSPAKYYMVTPAPDLTKDPLAAPQIIVDYNYNPAGEAKDTGIGIVYQVETKDGTTKAVFKQVLQGTILAVARAYVGIVVQPNGSEKLILPVVNSSLPMMFTKDGKKVSALQDTGMTKTMTDAVKQTFNFKFWYNALTLSYLAQVTRQDGVSFYIDLTTGICYDWDGVSDVATVRLNQSPLYQGDATGDYLFVGQDQYNQLKIAFKNPDNKNNQYEPYSLLWTVDPQGEIIFGSIRTANGTLNFNNFMGSQFTLDNDFGDSEIRVGYVYKDPAGNPLPSAQNNLQPFYAVWSKDDDNHFYFKDKYDAVSDLNYSLLIYQQSRNVGQQVSDGAYVDADNMHYVCIEKSTDPNADEPFTVVVNDKPCSDTATKTGLLKIVGIVFDKNKNFKHLYYKGQLISLSVPSKTAQGTVYSGAYNTTNTDGSVKQNPITVTVSSYAFPGTPLPMSLISITDGSKMYDFTYDYHMVNTSPLVDPKEINLRSLMRDTWKLNVTSFIPNKYMQSTKKVVDGVTSWVPNSLTGTLATTALAGGLSFGSKPKPISCSASDIGCDANILAQALKSITVYTDTNEKTIYIPNIGISGKKIMHFLYKLGVNQWDQGKSYYPISTNGGSFLNGYSVDLATGILYYPPVKGVMYPVGISLLPSQLAELLDTLDLAVHLDADGYPDGLEYRSLKTIDEKLEQAVFKKAFASKRAVQKNLRAIKPKIMVVPSVSPAKKKKKPLTIKPASAKKVAPTEPKQEGPVMLQTPQAPKLLKNPVKTYTPIQIPQKSVSAKRQPVVVK